LAWIGALLLAAVPLNAEAGCHCAQRGPCPNPLVVCAVGVDEGGLDCGSEAGLYQGDNLRRAWIRRIGVIGQPSPLPPSEVFSLMFSDGHRFVLLKSASLRVRFRDDLAELERYFGPVLPSSDNLVPAILQMTGDDGSSGPVLRLVGCEQLPALPPRPEMRDVWD